MQPGARRAREGLDRARLVHDQVVHLLWLDLHAARAEALQVGKRRLGADRDAAADREPHRPADRRRIAAVEAAGDIRRADERHHAGVVAHLPGAVALAHVAVQIDRLQCPNSHAMLCSTASTRALTSLRSSTAVSRLHFAKCSVAPGASCASLGTSAYAISAILG